MAARTIRIRFTRPFPGSALVCDAGRSASTDDQALDVIVHHNWPQLETGPDLLAIAMTGICGICHPGLRTVPLNRHASSQSWDCRSETGCGDADPDGSQR